ncbi:MAG: hypothetical protein FWD49_07585, partial [Firmicutes bacterium]|nr:hypothetical protein [Bacillota bacterium]
MNKMKRILVVFIVLIFALTPFAIAGCAGEGKKDGGKAVIILPGILGSILVNQSGNSMYFFNPGGDFGLGFGEGDYKPDVRFGDFRYILSVLTDEDGNNVECKLHVGSVHTPNLRPPHPFDELQHSGGTINHLLPLYSGLMAEFGDDHTVVTWQYDWRMGIAPAADKLDAFIKAQNYSEVVLVAHSMGGLLANAYLAKGQAQRDKVSLYVTYAAPHGGVVDALYALETGDQVFFDLSDFGAIGTMVGGVIDTVLQMPCFPDLIPNKALLESSFYKNQEAGVPSFIEIEYEKGKYKFLTDW